MPIALPFAQDKAHTGGKAAVNGVCSHTLHPACYHIMIVLLRQSTRH